MFPLCAQCNEASTHETDIGTPMCDECDPVLRGADQFDPRNYDPKPIQEVAEIMQLLSEVLTFKREKQDA